jgi:serine acetyltransferase
MNTKASTTTSDPQGIAVSTAVAAGGFSLQHAEGIVISTTLKAGQIEPNHSEGLVVG